MTTTSRRISALLALVAPLALSISAPSSAGAAPDSPAPTSARLVAHRILGPGTTDEPGFSGYVTAGGGALGVARLPGGRFGICLDTGPRAWPTTSGTSVHRGDPRVGYLTSRYLPVARHDAVTAAALWWAVGLDLGLNSSPARMRGHLVTLQRESPALYTRIAGRHRALLADMRSHASATGVYRAGRPVLGATTISGLVVRNDTGRVVPGIGGVLRLSGGVFADGTHTWRGAVPVAGSAGPRWHRTSGGRVELTARYLRVPASGFTLVRSGPTHQRVAVSAGERSLSTSAALAALPRPTLHTTVSSTHAFVGQVLTDTVVVSGAGTASVTGQWRLLGPIAPGASGCAGLDWSGAPLAASGGFTATGDGSYVVGSTTVAAAGCYTYVERLAASSRTRATAWTPAGASTETSLVVARPTVHTTVSAQSTTVGATITDHVQVDGVPAGTTAVLHWRLLGPVAPVGNTCRGVSWTHAPTRSQGTMSVHSGTWTVPVTPIRRGGCYTYQERLDATALSTATAWTTAGLATESTTALPASPAIPQHPAVDTGGSWRPGGRPMLRGTTAEVAIPGVGLSSPMQPVHFRSSTLTPPSVNVAGWWSEGARLDDLVGTTVVAGHVSDDHDRPAPFSRLRQVKIGAIVNTTATDGSVARWRVTGLSTYDRSKLPRSLFVQHLARRLVLITCTDKVTYPNGAFHYRRNLVVTAVPVTR